MSPGDDPMSSVGGRQVAPDRSASAASSGRTIAGKLASPECMHYDVPMPSLQIRDVPEELYEALSLRARAEHRSLAQQAIVELGRIRS